jgi:hypothetical protein
MLGRRRSGTSDAPDTDHRAAHDGRGILPADPHGTQRGSPDRGSFEYPCASAVRYPAHRVDARRSPRRHPDRCAAEGRSRQPPEDVSTLGYETWNPNEATSICHAR